MTLPPITVPHVGGVCAPPNIKKTPCTLREAFNAPVGDTHINSRPLAVSAGRCLKSDVPEDLLAVNTVLARIMGDPMSSTYRPCAACAPTRRDPGNSGLTCPPAPPFPDHVVTGTREASALFHDPQLQLRVSNVVNSSKGTGLLIR
jgi:hypothetical protein